VINFEEGIHSKKFSEGLDIDLLCVWSPCNILSKITPRYFTLIAHGIFRPFNITRKTDDTVRSKKQIVCVLASFTSVFQHSHWAPHGI
jgi:hypothetical protein